MSHQHLLRPSTSTIPSKRLFSTTSVCCTVPKDNPLGQRLLRGKTIPPPPPYPYGPAKWYKQSDTGLYGGAMVMFGNNVAPKSEVKTRRAWHPNVVHKSLFSPALGKSVRLKVTVRALRTIDKVGGLDNYLLGGTAARLKELGEHGWKLRWALINTTGVQERMKEDPELRRAIGHMADAPRQPELRQPESAAEQPTGPAEVAAQEKEDMALEEDGEIEQRIRDRLEQDQLMREEPPPPRSLWQKIKGVFGRS